MQRQLAAGAAGLLIAATGAAGQTCGMAVTRASGAVPSLWLGPPGGALCSILPVGMTPAGVVHGPGSALYVWGQNDGPLYEFNSQTLAFVRIAAPEGVAGPIQGRDLVSMANGDVLVAGGSSDSVVRINPTTGAFVGTFVQPGAGGLDTAFGMAVGPNGNLFVASHFTHEIKEYRGDTGEFVGTFIEAQSGGLLNPYDLAFDTAGRLYVTAINEGVVYRYGSDGFPLGPFTTTPVPPARGVNIGPNGAVYVCSWGGPAGGGVYAFHPVTGGLIGQAVALPAAMFASFRVPAPPLMCPADWNLDFSVNSNDLAAFINSWLASLVEGTLLADFSGNGEVNSNDLGAFINAWLDAVQDGC